MPSRSRSRSPERPTTTSSSKARHHKRHGSRDKKTSNNDDDNNDGAPPPGTDTLSVDDYFLKSAEFARWLREEKGKYFDELDADKSRSYFRKFVKAWNRGKLRDELYTPLHPSSAPSTAYKWSFASNRSRVNADELRRVRDAVGGATYGGSGPSTSSPPPRRMQGPTLPSAADLQLAREDAASHGSAAQLAKRKRERGEDRERVEDAVGPKEVGREGALEKKRVRREGDRAFRDAKEEGGLEVADSVLMGGGGSFKERIAQRDAARARFEAKKREQQLSKVDERRERVNDIKERDRKTMEMFKQMAKERFG